MQSQKRRKRRGLPERKQNGRRQPVRRRKRAKPERRRRHVRQQNREAARKAAEKQEVKKNPARAAVREAAPAAVREAAPAAVREAVPAAAREAVPAAAREAVPAATRGKSTQMASSNGQAVVDYARQFLGNPYVYGGNSLTNGTDCSGFVKGVYAAFGINLPRTSSEQRSVGYAVSLSEIQPGDIVCYSGHVGIYAGNNTLIHASNEKTGITLTSPVTYRSVLAVRRIF